MASETLVSIKWNPNVFRHLMNGRQREDVAKTLGISTVFLDKLIAGKKKLSAERLANICMAANIRPNDFFEIVVKNS